MPRASARLIPEQSSLHGELWNPHQLRVEAVDAKTLRELNNVLSRERENRDH